MVPAVVVVPCSRTDPQVPVQPIWNRLCRKVGVDGAIRPLATAPEGERVPDPASLDQDEVWEKDWEQNLLEVAMEKVKSRVDNDLFQAFHLHVVKQWPVEKVARTTGVNGARVYFAKYKVSRLVKKEVDRLKQQLI